ncbi:hypothetical protein JCM8097_007399 [Rhodosporidiobolus ruineniae]
MQQRRQQEIEAKRARLAQLRAAREEKDRLARANASASTTSSSSALPHPGSSRTVSERPGSRTSLGDGTRSRNDEIEHLLRGVGVGSESRDAGAESPLRRSTGVWAGGRVESGATSQAGESEEPPSSSRASPTVEMLQGEPTWTAPPSSQPDSSLSQPPTLTSSSIEIYSLPPKPRTVYDKYIQTSFDYSSSPSLDPSSAAQTDFDAEDSAGGGGGGAGRETADELRARIIAELEAERQALDAAIAAEKALADASLEAERARGLPPPQLEGVLSSPSFVDFLETSTKIVQRALSDPYDYLRDYTVTDEKVGEEGGKQRVSLVGSWWDRQWGRGRSVTGVDWSPKFPELFVASYNKNPLAVHEPDGIAAVWNLHLQERPEFVFHAQSDLLSIAFSPFHPNLLVGGTYSGQILLFDTRSRHPNPVLKTPLSASGHTHPVYSLQHVGTQHAHSLVSASTDGTVCAWALDMLARPQETLELVHPAHAKTDEVSITALAFPLGETASFWVGTEEGPVYAANRYDRAGAKAGLVQSEVYRGHLGPVTALDFHPTEGAVDLSDLFLTAGVDWTVKLWRAGGSSPSSSSSSKPSSSSASKSSSKPLSSSSGPSSSSLPSSGSGAGTIPPLFSFEEADDYVYDVKWHPKHPAVFGSVDGAGRFDVWNLNVDTEVPLVSTPVHAPSHFSSNPSSTLSTSSRKGLNKLAWDRAAGRRAAVGAADGKVYVYELAADLVTPREGEWEQLRKTVNQAVAAGAAGDKGR